MSVVRAILLRLVGCRQKKKQINKQKHLENTIAKRSWDITAFCFKFSQREFTSNICFDQYSIEPID